MNYFGWKNYHGHWSPRLWFEHAPVIHKEDRERYTPLQATELTDLQQCVRVWPAPQEKLDG